MAESDFDRGYDRGFKDAMEQVKKNQAKRGGGKKPIRSLADVEDLSSAEVNERWSEVQAVLGGQR